MANHGVVNVDNMAATKLGSLIKSCKFYSGSNPAAIDNGHIVAVGDLLDGEKEIHKATAPASVSAGIGTLGVVASVEYDEDPRNKSLLTFTNAEGAILRVLMFHSGDNVSVTADCFDTTPAVGKLVEIAANATTFKVVSAATSGSTQIGKIIDTWTSQGITYYGIAVA